MSEETKGAGGRRNRPDRLLIGVQLQGAEAAVFRRIYPQVRKRHPRVTRVTVFRELVGQDLPVYTTAKEREQWGRLPKQSVAQRPKAGRPVGSTVVDRGGKKTVAPPTTLTA